MSIGDFNSCDAVNVINNTATTARKKRKVGSIPVADDEDYNYDDVEGSGDDEEYYYVEENITKEGAVEEILDEVGT